VHRRLGIGALGDIQLDGEQVVRRTDGTGNGAAVSARGHHRMAGRQGRLCEFQAHAAAGAGDEPNSFLAHDISFGSTY
jgi:hypothetical protein